MRICKHLNILDKCSASRGLSIIVAAQLASANRMRGNKKFEIFLKIIFR